MLTHTVKAICYIHSSSDTRDRTRNLDEVPRQKFHRNSDKNSQIKLHVQDDMVLEKKYKPSKHNHSDVLSSTRPCLLYLLKLCHQLGTRYSNIKPLGDILFNHHIPVLRWMPTLSLWPTLIYNNLTWTWFLSTRLYFQIWPNLQVLCGHESGTDNIHPSTMQWEGYNVVRKVIT